MSGTLTQAPKHRAASVPTISSDPFIHLPQAPTATTPNLLRAAATAIGVLSLIAAVCVSGFAGSARAKIATVGATDGPSVKATEDFVFQLQDMDAQLLNALLANDDTDVKVPRAKSEQLYDRDRSTADGDLEAATTALAGDRQALDRLHALTDAYGRYQARAVRTLADDERDGGTVAGKAPQAIIEDYLACHDILFGADDQGGLVKAANDLEQVSAAAIDDSSAAAADSLDFVTTALVLFGLAILGALVALQVFTTRRFHRTLSPGLAAATLAALAFTIGGAAATAAAGHQFQIAKSDAFNSVIALSQAKALGSGANADESRWLLVHDNPALQSRFESSYVAASQQLASAGPATSATGYDNSMNDMDDRFLAKRWAVESRQDRPNGQDFLAADLTDSGLTAHSDFGQEFQNLTFTGEADLAFTAFHDYVAYTSQDAALRHLSLATDWDLRAAVDSDTDADGVGTSDHAFAIYNDSLDKLIQLNQDHFSTAMPAARDGIGVWTWLPYLLALLIIGATVLGIRPRLVEYR
ncbi:MAG: hypothetical protein HOV87_28000 [Catenulispora sp.]|nr:hypothetical protein [Catenulispora sp.]